MPLDEMDWPCCRVWLLGCAVEPSPYRTLLSAGNSGPPPYLHWTQGNYRRWTWTTLSTWTNSIIAQFYRHEESGQLVYYFSVLKHSHTHTLPQVGTSKTILSLRTFLDKLFSLYSMFKQIGRINSIGQITTASSVHVQHILTWCSVKTNNKWENKP